MCVCARVCVFMCGHNSITSHRGLRADVIMGCDAARFGGAQAKHVVACLVVRHVVWPAVRWIGVGFMGGRVRFVLLRTNEPSHRSDPRTTLPPRARGRQQKGAVATESVRTFDERAKRVATKMQIAPPQRTTAATTMMMLIGKVSSSSFSSSVSVFMSPLLPESVSAVDCALATAFSASMTSLAARSFLFSRALPLALSAGVLPRASIWFWISSRMTFLACDIKQTQSRQLRAANSSRINARGGARTIERHQHSGTEQHSPRGFLSWPQARGRRR